MEPKESKGEITITIDYVATESKEYNGNWSRGVKVGDKWYNVRADTKEKVDAMFNEDMLHRGNRVKVDTDGKLYNITKFVALIGKSEESHGDDMLNLEKLLADAHSKGLVSITTEMISHDPEKKSALFKAIVRMPSESKTEPPTDRVFHAHGDADKENLTNSNIQPHYVRMAETRAICRALRWATNNAAATEEEKG